MTTQVPTDTPHAGAPVVRRDLWPCLTPAALGLAGALHLRLALTGGLDGAGLVTKLVLLLAFGQLAAACFLGGLLGALLLVGMRLDLRLVVLVAAGTTVLAILDVVAHTTALLPDLAGISALHGTHGGAGHVAVGGALVGAEMLAVLALTPVLPGPWPRRGRELLLGLGVLVWLLWLGGVLG
jgi:hypothetical protein